MKLHRILRERWCFDARRAVTRTAGWRWRSFGRRRNSGSCGTALPAPRFLAVLRCAPLLSTDRLRSARSPKPRSAAFRSAHRKRWHRGTARIPGQAAGKFAIRLLRSLSSTVYWRPIVDANRRAPATIAPSRRHGRHRLPKAASGPKSGKREGGRGRSAVEGPRGRTVV